VSQSPSTAARRIDALTGLRAVAIIAVICRHAIPDYTPWPTGATYRVAWGVLSGGWVGVDVFFVLSGYLITGILLEARGDGPSAPAGYYRAFYIRRALRIFPVYYVFLAWVFLFRGPVDPRSWWYWTYLTNVYFARTGWWAQPHLWSLAVEEQFYLFWPAAISVLRRRRLRPTCWAIILGATAVRIALSFHSGMAAYVLTVCRMDEFAAGALLASYSEAERQAVHLDRWARVALVASTVMLIALAAGRVLVDALVPTALEAGVLLATIATVGCIALVTMPGASPLLTRLLTSPALVSIGTYSYTMYIVHYQIGITLDRAIGWPIAAHRWLAVVRGLNVAVISWAVAWCSWHLLENPVLSLKRYVPMPRPSPVLAISDERPRAAEAESASIRSGGPRPTPPASG
jgi:peptidoglycan/LPS O-acetylase OafA/YrhL